MCVQCAILHTYTNKLQRGQTMQNLYTVEALTTNEVNLLMQLVEHEASYYDSSDDETDSTHFNNCQNVLNKLFNATQTN